MGTDEKSDEHFGNNNNIGQNSPDLEVKLPGESI